MSRHLLAPALLLSLAACATVPPQSTPTEATRPTARFKILQINDVYKIEGLESGKSGGLARVRTLRKHLESDGTPVLVLHGGDVIYPSVMSKYLEARPMIDVMNMLDGDATKEDLGLVVTFGNHEFDNKDAGILMARLNDSAFQWVSTNVRWCNPNCDQRFPNQRDIFQVEVDDVKVAMFGLTYPLRKSYVQATDPITAAHEAVDPLLLEGVDVIIAVTHQEMTDDVKLLQQVPGIDLVIGGHDHMYMTRQVNGEWITKADADAKSAIVYDITVSPEGEVRTAPLRVALDETIPKDPEVDARVQMWLGELAAKLGGNVTRLHRDEEQVKGGWLLELFKNKFYELVHRPFVSARGPLWRTREAICREGVAETAILGGDSLLVRRPTFGANRTRRSTGLAYGAAARVRCNR
ncbi:MAG: metallophosphoesterase [Thermoanaerobaculia bacterium]